MGVVGELYGCFQNKLPCPRASPELGLSRKPISF